jgi:membrane fusion protein, multidrug efflux system
LQGGYQVAVVGPGNKTNIRTVEVGERVGTMWIISHGLEPGQQVVAEGTQMVRDGMVVTPKSFSAPAEKR